MTTIYLAYISEKYDVPVLVSAHLTKDGAFQSASIATDRRRNELTDVFRDDDTFSDYDYTEVLFWVKEVMLQE